MTAFFILVRFGLRVTTSRGKVYPLRCDSADERGNWHTAIRTSINTAVVDEKQRHIISLQKQRLILLKKIHNATLYLSDDITGTRLDMKTQTVNIRTDATKDAMDWAYDWAPCNRELKEDDIVRTIISGFESDDRIRNEGGRTGRIKRKNRWDEKLSIHFDDDGSFLDNYEKHRQYLEIPRKIVGIQNPEFAAAGTVDDLMELLIKEEAAPPVLMCAGPGTGKTLSVIKMANSMAEHLLSHDYLPFLPLVIQVQKLVLMIQRADSYSSTSLLELNEDLIFDYAAEMFKNNDDVDSSVAVVKAAFRAQSLVLFFDGVDEANGMEDDIASLVLEKLINQRRLITSRETGVHLPTYASQCILVALKKMDDSEQLESIRKQIGDNEYMGHLMEFSRIRREHDELYNRRFDGDARVSIEGMTSPDAFVDESTGEYRPEMLQRTLTESRPVMPLREGAECQSEILKELSASLTPRVLDQLESVLNDMGDLTENDILLKIQNSDLFENGRNLEYIYKIAHKLALLVRSTEGATFRALWHTISRATDELFVIAEYMQETFKNAMYVLLKRAGLSTNEETLLLGALKDPVRVYQKSRDDYLSRFGEKLAVGCIVDVLRCRVICPSATKMTRFQTVLLKGLQNENLNGKVVSSKIVRSKNKFRYNELDPTHLRNLLNNMAMTVSTGQFIVVEVQIHHADILALNDDLHAHDHYDFFRALLQDYAGDLDRMLVSTIGNKEPLLKANRYICFHNHQWCIQISSF